MLRLVLAFAIFVFVQFHSLRQQDRAMSKRISLLEAPLPALALLCFGVAVNLALGIVGGTGKRNKARTSPMYASSSSAPAKTKALQFLKGFCSLGTGVKHKVGWTRGWGGESPSRATSEI